jgi:hypothetical protein
LEGHLSGIARVPAGFERNCRNQKGRPCTSRSAEWETTNLSTHRSRVLVVLCSHLLFLLSQMQHLYCISSRSSCRGTMLRCGDRRIICSADSLSTPPSRCSSRWRTFRWATVCEIFSIGCSACEVLPTLSAQRAQLASDSGSLSCLPSSPIRCRACSFSIEVSGHLLVSCMCSNHMQTADVFVRGEYLQSLQPTLTYHFTLIRVV